MPTSGQRIDISAVTTLADLARVLRWLRRREARLRRGRELTYHQIAARTGWSPAIIGSYLNGAVLPPTDRFDTLVVLLGARTPELGPLASARDRVADGRRRGEPGAGTATSPPRELPAGPTHFVGRTAALASLDALAFDPAAAQMRIAVVTGMAGVGKTALALRWAHRSARHFPDGQLYVDLRGFGPGEPVDPAEALAGFLRALGLHAGLLPDGLPERAARYRTLLAGRRMVVLLDNGYSAEQIRPLLPTSPLCTVLVTSRSSLSGLVSVDGATRLALDVLPPGDATALLHRLIGERVDATPEAAAALAASCGHLPLAMRIAAEVAVRRAAVPLQDLVGDLTDERTRLDALDTGESRTAVRTVLSWSYRALTADAAHLFRLFGLAPGPHLTLGAVASLGGLEPSAAHRLTSELNRAHVLLATAPGRYALHDLLRVYAGELADAQLDPADRTAPQERLLDHYLHTAMHADQLLEADQAPLDLGQPARGTVVDQFDSTPAALSWFAVERPALLAAVRLAARLGRTEHVWRLAWALSAYLERAGHWPDMLAVNTLALETATDPADRSRAHFMAARAAFRLGQVDATFDHYRRALLLRERTGDVWGQAAVHTAIGNARSDTGAVREALHHHYRALDLFRQLGNRMGEAAALNNVGYNEVRNGAHQAALRACQEALAIVRELGSPIGEGHCSHSLGQVHLSLGGYEVAIGYFDEAVARFEQTGAEAERAEAWTGLGDAYAGCGRPDAARSAWQSALEILDDLGQPATGVRSRLGTGHAPPP